MVPGYLLLLAVVAPLVLFAGTPPWGEPLAASGVIIAAAVTGAWGWRRRPPVPVSLPLAGAFLLAAFVAMGQALPVPGWIAATLAPASHRVWTSAPFGGDEWHPLSLAPHASAGRAALWLSAALMHAAAAWWIGARQRQQWALSALAATAVFVCALAVAERIGGFSVWLGGFSQPEQAFGPFPNRNDLGILAAAAAPLTAAGLLGPLGRLARRARASAEGWAFALRSGPDTPIAAAWAGGLALLSGAVLASGSHSALVALAAGLGLFAGAAWFRRGAPRWTLSAAIAVVALAAIAGAARGAAPSAAPMAGDLAVRRPLWSRVIAIARDLPVTGCGAGAIGATLPLHPDPASPGVAARAENDLLETAAELGLPATLALLLLAGMWLKRALRAAREAGDSGLAAAAAVGAIAALATGSMGTFVVSVPALLLFGAAAAALGVPGTPEGIAEARAAALPRRRRRLAIALVAGGLALPVTASRGAAAWIARTRLPLAARLDPSSPEIALHLARSHERRALASPEPWKDAPEEIAAAANCYLRRLRSRPTDAYARLGLAALLETTARDPSLTSGTAAQQRLSADALRAAALDMDRGDPAVARYRIR